MFNSIQNTRSLISFHIIKMAFHGRSDPGSVNSRRIEEIWNQPTPLYDELMRTRKATDGNPHNPKLAEDQKKFAEVLNKFQRENLSCRFFFNYPKAADGTAMSFQTNSHIYYNEFKEAERRCAIFSKFPEITDGVALYSKRGLISFFEQKTLREERERQSRELFSKQFAERRERAERRARIRLARTVPKGNLLGLERHNSVDLIKFPSREEELGPLFNYHPPAENIKPLGGAGGAPSSTSSTARIHALRKKHRVLSTKVPKGNLLGLGRSNEDVNLLKFPSRLNEMHGLFNSKRNNLKTRKNK